MASLVCVCVCQETITMAMLTLLLLLSAAFTLGDIMTANIASKSQLHTLHHECRTHSTECLVSAGGLPFNEDNQVRGVLNWSIEGGAKTCRYSVLCGMSLCFTSFVVYILLWYDCSKNVIYDARGFVCLSVSTILSSRLQFRNTPCLLLSDDLVKFAADKRNPCPRGWFQFNSRCFMFVKTAMTWPKAEV